MKESRELPRDHDAEASVLGGLMYRNALLKQLPDLEVKDFHNPKHQAVFEAIQNLDRTMVPFDPVTINAEIVRLRGTSEPVGGLAFLAELSLRVPSVDNVLNYAAIVTRHRVKRDTMEALSSTLDDLFDVGLNDELDGEAAAQHAAAKIAKVRTRSPSSSITIGAAVEARLDELERITADRESGGHTLTGVPTGVGVLDRHLGGAQLGIVTIVAARPAMGKSALCIGIADAASAAHQGAHVFSLEDSIARYSDRTLARHSRVSPQDFAQAKLTRGQMADLGSAITRLRLRQGWILDTASTVTADEIVRAVRRDGERNRTRVVIVDYVQMVRPFDRRAPRHEQLDEIITTFANAAKADNVAYVVASQLNRKLEERPDKRPTLADLKESGALEERCKACVMLYRGAVYGPPVEGRDYKKGDPMPSWGTPESAWERTIELLVTKNTSGATGDLVASWNGPLTMIS